VGQGGRRGNAGDRRRVFTGRPWTYEDGDSDSGSGSDEDNLLLLKHADGSAVTVLAQDGDYEGLHMQLPDGDWLPVPIVPGALQVFSGTLLTRWTNGLLRPPRHGVVAGRHGGQAVDRRLLLPGAAERCLSRCPVPCQNLAQGPTCCFMLGARAHSPHLPVHGPGARLAGALGAL